MTRQIMMPHELEVLQTVREKLREEIAWLEDELFQDKLTLNAVEDRIFNVSAQEERQ